MGTRFKLKDGYELRGFVVRLYPTKEQVAWLEDRQAKLRVVWNWLVSMLKEQNDANETYAVRAALVSTRPCRPDYDGMSPEEATNVKDEHRRRVNAWYAELARSIKGRDECEVRWLSDYQEQFGDKFDYQTLKRVASWKGITGLGAHELQWLMKNYQQAFKKGRKAPRHKKSHQPMPVGVASGACLELGVFGARGRNPEYYNCQASLGRIKIRGRLPGRVPPGRVLEGVTFREEADGWYASFRVELPTRVVQDPVPGTKIGLDVGLDVSVAFSRDLKAVPNTRGIYFNNVIADLQKRADTSDDVTVKKGLMAKSARIHQQARRHVKHELYTRVVKALSTYETIQVEELPADIGQRGSRKLSVMRTVTEMLKARYGSRVREVSAAYTSQTCSRCGVRDKESWAYERGGWGKCCSCGFELHRDLNAARNIEVSTLYVDGK